MTPPWWFSLTRLTAMESANQGWKLPKNIFPPLSGFSWVFCHLDEKWLTAFGRSWGISLLRYQQVPKESLMGILPAKQKNPRHESLWRNTDEHKKKLHPPRHLNNRFKVDLGANLENEHYKRVRGKQQRLLWLGLDSSSTVGTRKTQANINKNGQRDLWK